MKSLKAYKWQNAATSGQGSFQRGSSHTAMQSDSEHAPIAVGTDKGQWTFISTQPNRYLFVSYFTFTYQIMCRLMHCKWTLMHYCIDIRRHNISLKSTPTD